jgi:hypothetical protein
MAISEGGRAKNVYSSAAKVVDFFGNTGNMICFFFVVAKIITGFFVGVVFFIN